MMKQDEEAGTGPLPFEMDGRNRRPPRDPVNAMLSLGYSLLTKDLTVACYAVRLRSVRGILPSAAVRAAGAGAGFDGAVSRADCGFGGADAVNTGMVTARDFVRAGGAVALTAGGRKAFFRAYEMRMDTLVTPSAI